MALPGLRLLADDLTGALDSAAELVRLCGPVQAFWHGHVRADLPPHAALDSGTRERDAGSAAAIVTALAPAMAGADIAFKKIDSLLRGPTIAEIAACWRTGLWDRAILAPAFPYQGRITRCGVQHARDHLGHWSPVGGHLVLRLREMGVSAQQCQPDGGLPPGISVFDAESEAELTRIAALGRAFGQRVLWIGTGGLAQALADAAPTARASPPAVSLPLLGLFGSDQKMTATQLAACGSDWLRLRDGGPAEVAMVAERLRARGRAVASLDLPAGIARDAAASRIAAELTRLVRDLPPPRTLVVGGGETLRGLCLSLGAGHLEVRGRLVPGLPISVLRGGEWDGVTVVSKSGAFGHPTLLFELLRNAVPPPGFPPLERTE